MKKKSCLCLKCLKAYTINEAAVRGHRCQCGGRIEKNNDKK